MGDRAMALPEGWHACVDEGQVWYWNPGGDTWQPEPPAPHLTVFDAVGDERE